MLLWFAGIGALIWAGFEIGNAYGPFLGVAFGLAWMMFAVAYIGLYDKNPDAEYGEEVAFAMLGGPISFLVLVFLRVKNRKEMRERRRIWAELQA